MTNTRIRTTAYCDKCGRKFDLLDPEQASEWSAGHDCDSSAFRRALRADLRRRAGRRPRRTVEFDNGDGTTTVVGVVSTPSSGTGACPADEWDKAHGAPHSIKRHDEELRRRRHSGPRIPIWVDPDDAQLLVRALLRGRSHVVHLEATAILRDWPQHVEHWRAERHDIERLVTTIRNQLA